jgi:hypothetical protein
MFSTLLCSAPCVLQLCVVLSRLVSHVVRAPTGGAARVCPVVDASQTISHRRLLTYACVLLAYIILRLCFLSCSYPLCSYQTHARIFCVCTRAQFKSRVEHGKRKERNPFRLQLAHPVLVKSLGFHRKSGTERSPTSTKQLTEAVVGA